MAVSYVAKISAGGRVAYLGRYPSPAEARAAEAAARAEFARTGTVPTARSVYARRPTRVAEEPGAEPEPTELNDGERDLMRAVLRGAIDDLRSQDAAVRSAAVRWFRSDERGYVLSFASIVDELDLDAREIRRSLLARRGVGAGCP